MDTLTPAQEGVDDMAERNTFFARIGSWIRKGHALPDSPFVNNEDGTTANDPARRSDLAGELNDPHALAQSVPGGSAESRSTFLRPWAKRDAAIENLQSGIGALAELMGGIRENLERTSQRQDELLRYLSHLPQALQQLPESNRIQGETLKAIHHRMEQQSEEQARLADILERISAADATNGRTLDALQERVHALNEHDQAIADNLNSVGVAMQTLGRHTETSAAVLQQMRDNSSSRDGELERILQKQGARFTAMLTVAIVLSVAALGAVGVVGYLMLNAPVR
jgi:chromosome segregation ATPase